MQSRAISLCCSILFLLVAGPSRATVRLESSSLFFSSVSGGEEIQNGVGLITRSFGFSDIGGCEGADETGEQCGGYESGSFTSTFTDNSLNYSASFGQDQALAGMSPQTSIDIGAVFRANRQVRFKVVEFRNVNVIRCEGACSSNFMSYFEQSQAEDGSWQVFVGVYTAAAVFEAQQEINHRFGVTLSEVPEPNAWLLMIFGFGLIGMISRRHNSGARNISLT